jgi:hypothetical protein
MTYISLFEKASSLDVVVYTYNPSHLEGRDKKTTVWGQPRLKKKNKFSEALPQKAKQAW